MFLASQYLMAKEGQKVDGKTETRHSELPLSLAQKQGLFLLLLIIGGRKKTKMVGWMDFIAPLSSTLKAFLFNGDEEQCIPISLLLQLF